MKELSCPEGVDCVWIAADSAGNVAAFITAGVGPIPDVLIDSEYIPLSDIEDRVMELPVTSSAAIVVDVPRPDDFFELSSRGLFVYDWRDAHRSAASSSGLYEIVAIPDAPLKLDGIRGDICEFLGQFTIDWLDFSESSSVEIINE